MRASWDDAPAEDVRLAELMNKYDIETTFYWPIEWHFLAYQKGYEPLRYKNALDISRDFEIGSHTITHRHLTELSIDEATYEIKESKYMLSMLFCKSPQIITKFAPPRGYTNDNLIYLTRMFYSEQRLTKGEGLLHIHPNSGANEGKHWLERAKEIEVKEIWGHGWEITKYNEWDNLEKFLANLRRES